MAHDAEPRLEISADRSSPGGTLDVRGVGFGFEETVRLGLIGPDIEIPIGELVADTEGSFLQIVTLPADIREGTYHVRAMTDDHEILSPVLTVQGGPIASDEGGEARDEDDALLAPMPTYISPTLAAPTAAMPASPVSAQPRSSLAWVLVAVGAAGAALVAGLSVRKRRR